MAFAAVLGALIVLELRHWWLQSTLLAAVARRITYETGPGSSPAIRFPVDGPYDRRLGYVGLGDVVRRLQDQGFQLQAQARWSPVALSLFDAGVFPIYPAKDQAGLLMRDRLDRTLYASRYPQRTYGRFEDIPSIVVVSLLFIENRELLLGGADRRNPAIEYDRLIRALLDVGFRAGDSTRRASGGSTLATQLEKLRHSPGGRTTSVADKGRQMLSASLRAYAQGTHTIGARQEIVRQYLNAMPLGAIAGYGEVHGLGDGLWAWYDADFNAATALLSGISAAPSHGPSLEQQGRIYRQTLSLLLAVQRPTMFLSHDREALHARTDAYLRALVAAGVISPALRDAAMAARVTPRSRVSLPVPSFVDRKGVDGVRVDLLAQLGVRSAYDLDRLDLTARATLDGTVTDAVSRVLGQMGIRRYAREAGLATAQLLGHDDPGQVVYSFTLYERSREGHRLRVQSDNVDQPLNINEGSRLELGSTAKLRTLVTYVEAVEALHRQYAQLPLDARATLHAPDRLSRWAIAHLARTTDRSLETMLDAALNRQYSASPAASFFTGGGVHRFGNFDAKDNARVMSVREAFQRSVNLVFIRVMQDLVDYHGVRSSASRDVLDDPTHPDRQAYLARFADREGQTFLQRFYRAHRGTPTAEALDRLARAGPRTAARLAVIFRAVRPEAGIDALAAYLQAHGQRGVPPSGVQTLYDRYDPSRWSLQDLGYLARVHPLELWLVSHLARHPAATLEEAIAASAAQRQQACAWLFKTVNRQAQQRALRTVMEVEAFERMHAIWQRHGYPFRSLVPSLATAIGSSGDNPAALSELVGLVLNDGVRHRTIRIDRMTFGERTPYETHLERGPMTGERVLSSEVASAIRRELVGVVAHGTGRRVADGVALPDGRVLEIGGKTGTGDNRFETTGPAGASSRVVSRTAAFVFTIGDRWFGTIVAFVPGRAAAAYEFTSALPVQIFKNLLPVLHPLLQDPHAGG